MVVENAAYHPNQVVEELRIQASNFLDGFREERWLEWARPQNLMPNTSGEADRRDALRRMVEEQEAIRAREKQQRQEAAAEKKRQAAAAAKSQAAGPSAKWLPPYARSEDDDVEMRSELGSLPIPRVKGKGKGKAKAKAKAPPARAVKVRRDRCRL